MGCSHSTIEEIVEAAKSATGKPIHLVLGASSARENDAQIRTIAVSLRNSLNVRLIAPAHCAGEPAFAILHESFGNRYNYAGLGTTVLLGPKVAVKAEARQPNKEAMDADDLRTCRESDGARTLARSLAGCWRSRASGRNSPIAREQGERSQTPEATLCGPTHTLAIETTSLAQM